MTTPPDIELTPEQQTALGIARGLAALGIPVFTANPDPSKSTGYALPSGWQQTVADPLAVDSWRPGMALCAVMGCGLDLVDIDTRNGGDPASMNGARPTAYGIALTPSGGGHLFVKSLGCGSLDGVYPGIDVKSGMPDGRGRGFAFLAPTVRISKVTGQPGIYRWAQPPDLAALGRVLSGEVADESGAELAARITGLKAGSSGGVQKYSGPDWWREFMASREPQSQPAADRAIADKLREVAEWEPGSGENFRLVLLRAAYTLGGYVGGGYLDEDDAREKLLDAVSAAWGSPNKHDRLWIDQGLADGPLQAFRVYTADDEQKHSEVAQAKAREGEENNGSRGSGRGSGGGRGTEPPWTIYTAIGDFPFDPALDNTDQGLAEAVAERMFPALRYACDAGSWIKRGRDVWIEIKDSDTVPNWAVSQVARLMPLGQTPVPKDLSLRTEEHWQAERRARFMDSSKAGKIARKYRALAHSDHPVSLNITDLDTNPEVLWAGGAPWDLRASGERPEIAAWIDHNTPHLHSALCRPDLEVPTPRWDAFLAAVLPDPEIRAWALRVLSIALTGYPDAVVPILYGRERSGKTSLVDMLSVVLGSYAHAANPKLLSASDTSHDAIVYDLMGRRLSFIDEGPKRGHENTERLKQLTGGGLLTAAKKYGNPITFKPTSTLVMTTNNEPQLTDPALRARMRLIPCDSLEAVVRPTRLPLLGRGLAEEAPGILAQLMCQTAAYLDDRDTASLLAAPLTIRGLAQEIGEGQDPVREWVTDCTLPADPGTPGRELYKAFVSWHQVQPLYKRTSIPTETAFGRTLTDMGHESYPYDRKRYRRLTVLGGSGPLPSGPIQASTVQLPTADSSGTRPSAGEVAGWAAGSSGSPTQPASADNAWSNPLFSSSFSGLAGIEDKSRVEKNKKIYRESREETKPSTNDLVTPGMTSADGGGAGYSANPLHPLLPGPNGLTSTPDLAKEVAEGSPQDGADLHKRPGEPTNSEVAARAYQGEQRKVISKAEARAQLKAEAKAAARQSAIREAAGEVLPLPAVVTRSQRIVELTPAEAGNTLAAVIGRSGSLTVDVETSGYPVGHEHYRLRSVQLGDDRDAVVLDPVQHAELIRTALAAAPRLHAHSATADLVPLAHAGLIDAEAGWARMVDTVIPAKLADPRSTGADPGLKKLAPAVLGDEVVVDQADDARAKLFKAGGWLKDTQETTPLEKSGWAQVETGCATMLRYAASDVLDTAALARRLPYPRPDVLERERAAQRATARIAHRGVRIDAEHVAHQTEVHRAAQASAAERVQAFGVENPGSNPQVAQKAAELGAELPRTKAGALSVAEGALEPLRGSQGALGAFVDAVLDYRDHSKVLSTYLGPYHQLCVNGDGRARPTIYTLGTDTGRMSAVRPNLQQLPRRGGVRACITADPGQLMIGADFSSVEIRVAAALSQDPTLLKMIQENRDLHMEIAKLVWGANATQEHRYKAKPMVFQRFYGGGVPGLARNNGVSETVAQAVVDAIDTLIPQYSAWAAATSTAVRQGYTQFPAYSGRIIHLPIEYPHKAANYCIQGTARELLVDALIQWEQTQWGKAVLMPIHDELDVFVPEEDAEEATRTLVQCMETELLGVPIVAKPSAPSFAWQDSS